MKDQMPKGKKSSTAKTSKSVARTKLSDFTPKKDAKGGSPKTIVPGTIIYHPQSEQCISVKP
jgi:hypothetical protein